MTDGPVRVRVKSIMKNAASPGAEKFLTETDGTLRHVNGRVHVRFYESLDEEKTGHTSCHIAIGEEAVDITRRGQASVTFHFENEKRTPADYETAFGRLKLEIYTEELDKTVLENEINIRLKYVIYASGMHASDCEVRIEITG